ncbi:hypothetical protein [Mangrovibacter phragmitis]|uniref:hypothetical protein n=1 Tax=Mangrovibacter phragmitis TaxID=1691903 RepID=UPI00336A2DA7
MMVAFSAYLKSWAVLYTLLSCAVVTTAIISLPFIVSPLQRSKYFALRVLRLFINTLWAIGLACVIFSFIDRLIWVNAESYPTWLAKDLTSPSIIGAENFIKAKDFFIRPAGKIEVILLSHPSVTARLCAVMMVFLSIHGGKVSTGLKHLKSEVCDSGGNAKREKEGS